MGIRTEREQCVRWSKTVRWYRMRKHQLDLEPCCKYCLREGRVEAATVADHVIPHRGNATLFWEGKLQSLCAFHHNSTKKQEEARGYAFDVGMDGLPVDPKHPVYAKAKL